MFYPRLIPHKKGIGDYCDCFFFFGNQPFSTLFFCWNSSRILQKKENPPTPRPPDIMMLSDKREKIIQIIPQIIKTGHIFVPKWYSDLTTMGWNIPIIRNESKPIIIPEKLFRLIRNPVIVYYLLVLYTLFPFPGDNLLWRIEYIDNIL